MNYRYIKRYATIEMRDTRSNHVWKYEIDHLNARVDIYKNGRYARTVEHVGSRINETWLEEIREGL